MRLTSVLFVVAASGCSDAASGPLENQTLGRTSGFFTQLTPDGVGCALSGIGVLDVRLSMTFGEDKRVATVVLPPLERSGLRVQQRVTLQYLTGESTPGAAEVERGVALVDPRLGEASRQSALEQRTSLYYPFFVHHLLIDAARLCDTTATGAPTTDCLDVPVSTMDDARFWCNVAPNTPPQYSE